MPELGVEVLVVVGFVLIVALVNVYFWSRYKYARPGERLVVYENGRTRQRLIVSPVPPGQSKRGRGVLVLPTARRRSVRVQGDLVEAWDEVRHAIRGGWEVEPPAEGRATSGWIVRASGLHGEAAEGTGSSEHEALKALAAGINSGAYGTEVTGKSR